MKSRVPYKWPFALDLLKSQYKANSEKRLMRFQSQYYESLGANFEINLFGNSGYVSTDPNTVETLLSTRFEGKTPIFTGTGDSEEEFRLWLGITQ